MHQVVDDDDIEKEATHLRLDTSGIVSPERTGTPSSVLSATTPRSTIARRRKHLPPVKDSTIADVFYDFISPKAWFDGFTSGGKRTLEATKTLRYTNASDVLSGLVVGILMSGFSAVFASTIFDEVELDKYVDMGVSSQ